MEKEGKRQNFSRKRLAIIRTLRSTTVHPTAEWVCDRVRRDYPDISLATVYRNLKEFCEDGTAISVGVIDGKEHFDGCVAPHAHFACRECGAVLDIETDAVSAELLQKLQERVPLHVESTNLLFQGVCPKCEEKLKQQSA